MMFSLDFIDESVSRLNIQPCDGDRPSCLRGCNHLIQIYTNMVGSVCVCV